MVEIQCGIEIADASCSRSADSKALFLLAGFEHFAPVVMVGPDVIADIVEQDFPLRVYDCETDILMRNLFQEILHDAVCPLVWIGLLYLVMEFIVIASQHCIQFLLGEFGLSLVLEYQHASDKT